MSMHCDINMQLLTPIGDGGVSSRGAMGRGVATTAKDEPMAGIAAFYTMEKLRRSRDKWQTPQFYTSAQDKATFSPCT